MAVIEELVSELEELGLGGLKSLSLVRGSARGYQRVIEDLEHARHDHGVWQEAGGAYSLLYPAPPLPRPPPSLPPLSPAF